jgi:hypothetical protein
VGDQCRRQRARLGRGVLVAEGPAVIGRVHQVQVVVAVAFPRQIEAAVEGGEGRRDRARVSQRDLARKPGDAARVDVDQCDIELVVPVPLPADVEVAVVRGEGRRLRAGLGRGEPAPEGPAAVGRDHHVEVVVAVPLPGQVEAPAQGRQRGGDRARVPERDLARETGDGARADVDHRDVQVIVPVAAPGDVQIAVVHGESRPLRAGLGGGELAPERLAVVGREHHVQVVVPVSPFHARKSCPSSDASAGLRGLVSPSVCFWKSQNHSYQAV